MRLKIFVTALISLALAIVLAAIGRDAIASTQISSGTQVYAVEYNANGAVLTPVGGEIYLGRTCDAYSEYLGDGTWGQANGGIRVEFPADPGPFVVGFPRQNIEIYSCQL